jgi:hypothetical protein
VVFAVPGDPSLLALEVGFQALDRLLGLARPVIWRLRSLRVAR